MFIAIMLPKSRFAYFNHGVIPEKYLDSILKLAGSVSYAFAFILSTVYLIQS